MKNTIREYWWIAIAIIFFSIVGIACPPLSGAAKVTGQAPRAVVPIRVAVTASAGEDWDLRKDLLRELQKFRNVVVVKDRPDVTIQLAAERFKGDCRGVVAAVLTTTRDGSDLQAVAGADWQEIAQYLANRIKQDMEGVNR